MAAARTRNLVALGICAGLTLISASGCTKTQAKTPGPIPVPLAVPDPPGRMHFPVDLEPPPPAATTEKPAPPATTNRPKPTPTPVATPAPTPTPVPPPDAAPPPVVQTNLQAEDEQRARTLLASAEENLGKINFKTLGREARQQYDTANNFVKAAKAALTRRNFRFARECADKAATLAALLMKR